jgi:hypothetical protein
VSTGDAEGWCRWSSRLAGEGWGVLWSGPWLTAPGGAVCRYGSG